MEQTEVPVLSAQALTSVGARHDGSRGCGSCSQLGCAGWDSLSSAFDQDCLQKIGTLRKRGILEPTVREYHPSGTNYWSANAPIALAYFPYNRCDAFQCNRCSKVFLRYTEFGGYYIDERIRELNPDLVCDPVVEAGDV
jgi:hypothetical protein